MTAPSEGVPRITAVSVADGGHSVRLSFADGVVGKVDLFDRLGGRGTTLGTLRFDRPLFAEVTVDPTEGGLVWPNGAALGAEELYYAIPVLRRPRGRGLYSWGLATGDSRNRETVAVAVAVLLVIAAVALLL